MTKMYTANQPLLLGGQTYMWNRYFQAKNLVHMMEAQFTKFGHQSRIELLNGQGQKQMFIVPLEDRNFRPLNDVYLQHIDKVGETFVKTLDALYPASKVKDANFRWGLVETFLKNSRYSLGRLNVAVIILLRSTPGRPTSALLPSLLLVCTCRQAQQSSWSVQGWNPSPGLPQSP